MTGKKLPYQTFEEWREYGLEQGYENRSHRSLKKSSIQEERGWYSNGAKKKWLTGFNFVRKHTPYEWKNVEDWINYGSEHGYDKRNPKSLDKGGIGKAWYQWGLRNKHSKRFKLNYKKPRSSFNSVEEWTNHGINKGYNEMHQHYFQREANQGEYSWYRRGLYKKWLTRFPFKRSNKKRPYTTFEEWYQFGVKQKYNERSPSSLDKSDNIDERSWYGLGGTKRWLRDFPFVRLRPQPVTLSSSQELESLLEVYASS